MNLRLSAKTLQNAKINITGSKSESNRLLILQALFPNLSVENLSNSDDTKFLQQALLHRTGTVDVHHAGTAMRFLTAYYALTSNTDVTLTGSSRMQERPIAILVNALRDLHANISYKQNDGFPPLIIKGTRTTVSKVSLAANVSSQYISGLMLVAPCLPQGLTITLKGKITSIPYIEMTLKLLKQIGVHAEFKKNCIHIEPKSNIADMTLVAESDWSSASYYYSLVALSEASQIRLSSYKRDSLQGDKALAEIYSQFGVETIFETERILLQKTEKHIQNKIVLDLSNTPDIAQTIAVTCFGLGIGCQLTGLHTLKIKETDRLVALQTELRKLGATIIVTNDSLELKPRHDITKGVSINTYNDHRMAMAFAPLALKTDVIINEANVVSKSYPDFWKDMNMVGITSKPV